MKLKYVGPIIAKNQKEKRIMAKKIIRGWVPGDEKTRDTIARGKSWLGLDVTDMVFDSSRGCSNVNTGCKKPKRCTITITVEYN